MWYGPADEPAAAARARGRTGGRLRQFMKTVVMLAMMSAVQQTGWYPHEGGNLDYRVHIRFGEEPDTMPAGWKFGRVSSVAVDSGGRVYVFHRGDKADPMVVFDAEGRYLRGWGKGIFSSPHAVRIDKQDHLWITDTGLHQVFEFTNEGQLLRQWGAKGAPGCDEKTFNKPTDVAFARDGSFYVSDGYGNSRVVKFSAEGKFLKSWGTKGNGPGEFNLPHVVQTDSRGTVYVSDRENNRIQVFDADGKFLRQWTHLGATQGMYISPRDEMWIITHRNNRENSVYDTLAGRIMKIDLATGKIIGSMESPGHWITLTPAGEIFIGSLTGNVFRWRAR